MAPADRSAEFARLAGLVSAAPGRLVLPERPRAARIDVPAPLRLLDALFLGGRRAVGVVQDAVGGRWTVPMMVGEQVRRAGPGDGVADALVGALGAAPTASAPFSITCWHSAPASGERAVTADQTNESVVVGEAAVVKWAVRLPAAGEPEQPTASRLAALAEAGFAHTPRPWGMLRWRSRDGRLVLATVASYLPGALDGWDWAVEDVRAFASGEHPLDRALAPARLLGGLTAGLHLAFAASGVEDAAPADGARWWRRALGDLDEALAAGGPECERLAERAGALRAAFGTLRELAGTPVIDVHGDLHVGQVLRSPSADGGHVYAITDFDGNPVLPPAERALRAPAALDVAGMLASLDHVGRVVARHNADADPGAVRSWIHAAQREFLAGYRGRLAAAGRGLLLDERLLWPLRLHQEVREHLYAIHHLPHWRYVPDAALLDLLPGSGPEAPDER